MTTVAFSTTLWVNQVHCQLIGKTVKQSQPNRVIIDAQTVLINPNRGKISKLKALFQAVCDFRLLSCESKSSPKKQRQRRSELKKPCFIVLQLELNTKTVCCPNLSLSLLFLFSKIAFSQNLYCDFFRYLYRSGGEKKTENHKITVQ